jgi:hypothetical protein
MATPNHSRVLGGLAAALLPFSGCGDPTETLAAQQNRLNGFDLANARVERSAILRGGPPRDGIPSIDAPRFLAPLEVDYLEGGDEVISFTHAGHTRAYPLRILVWHEIVNDELAGRPVVVTYCPLCGTGMVFDRRVGDRTLTFGVSGLLYQSDVLMYDRETESLWSQLSREAVTGEFAGTELRWLPAEQMTWAAWRTRHPEGAVLSTETGFQRNYKRLPYAGYEASPELIFPVPEHRVELPRKEWVLGITIAGAPHAYPLKDLPDRQIVEDQVNGRRLELFHDRSARHVRVTDAITNELIPSVRVYWFAWQAFYPRTTLWSPDP